jgi:hypothetical protein
MYVILWIMLWMCVVQTVGHRLASSELSVPRSSLSCVEGASVRVLWTVCSMWRPKSQYTHLPYRTLIYVGICDDTRVAFFFF